MEITNFDTKKIKINCDDVIKNVFMKYYEMTRKMENVTKHRLDDDDKEDLIAVQVHNFKTKKINNIKWRIICEIIEHLMAYLHRNDMIRSEMIWMDIIEQLLLQNSDTPFLTKTNVIILSRI